MKITIRKLGIIQEAQIDLKPLTILVGPNNAGKTWLAYALFGILSLYSWDKYVEAYIEGKLSETYQLLDSALQKVLREGNATIDIYEFADNEGEKYFQKIADFAQKWMPDLTRTQLITFDEMRISLDLTEAKEAFLEQIKLSSLRTSIAGGALRIRKRKGEKTVYIYTSESDKRQITEKLPAEDIRERVIRDVLKILHQSLYPNVYVLPTERAAFILFRFGSRRRARAPFLADEKVRNALDALAKAIQQLPELEGADLNAIIDPDARVVTGPVGFFLSSMDYVFDMGTKEVEQRGKSAKDNPQIQRYMQLSRILEQQILIGGLNFSTPEPEPRRDLLFHPSPDIALEIPITSSMVKELAPLVLYLRYMAQPNELLVIDEPEMNLHPEAQAKMIEFLAMLVRAGLHVLVTTHSSYMVDHLVNLIQAAEHEQGEQEALADMFFLQNAEAFISQNDVSVYLIDQGKAENILHDGKINWSTFGNVSDQIAQIHFAV